MSIEKNERRRIKLQTGLDKLIAKIGKVQIGSEAQFPFGWRKAAKGRTVWRILEEVITQNLAKYYDELGITRIITPDSEVGVYDFAAWFEEEDGPVYVNIKSSGVSTIKQRDDISKGSGLIKFYEADRSRDLFIATFFLEFHDDMTIEVVRCTAIPIAWIPDVYVNPSNGNLQSYKYKSLSHVVRRSSADFFTEIKNVTTRVSQKKRPKLKSNP